MKNEEKFKINKSILTLLDDIKYHLSKVQSDPLSQIYSEIPEELLKANVKDIKAIAKLRFQNDSNPQSLTLTYGLTNTSASLSKATLSVFGLSIDGFLNGIQAIQDTNSNNTLKEAIEKTIQASLERFLENHADVWQETMEETLKTTHKRFLEDQLSRTILLYAQLYEKVRSLNPTDSKEEIFARLDTRFHNHFKSTSDNSNELPSAYYDFINAYQKKKVGFFAIFGDTKNDLAPYNITQKLIENSGSELTAYLNIIHTIEKIPAYLQDKSAATQLKNRLKHLSDNYFATLLQINSSESTEDTKRNKKIEAFENFKQESTASIKDYKKDHPKESTRAKSFLNKLLWFITKLIPLINQETRMMMFGGPKKASSLLFKNIDREITRITPAPAA